jgi:Xaa-Pro dipeptidase
MSFTQKLADVRQALKEAKIDGWLLYDYRQTNGLATQFLEIPSDLLLTRRFFYWIPQQGNSIKILNKIEPYALEHLPGDISLYGSWKELETTLETLLKDKKCIAMEYSSRNAIPAISKVDAGTIDLIRHYGVDVVSSSYLLQLFTSVLSNDQIQSHLQAAEMLNQTALETWDFIQVQVKKNIPISEWDVQKFILHTFKQNNYITSHVPICAVNANSANPHYVVSYEKASPIRTDDFVLIDLWCKQNHANAIYADITRVGVVAPKPTQRQNQIFEIVRAAQEAATNLVRKRFADSNIVRGYEVDQAARNVIEKAGFGEYFIHRTGHNIGTEDHGPGTHIDNYETHDDRLILPRTCFSIEPGIYLSGEFGVRLEYDICIHSNNQVEVTGGIQNSITCLL